MGRPSDAAADAAAGGIVERRADRGNFVRPTVLVDATADHQVIQEEIFGPVVAALPFGGYRQSGWGPEIGEDVLEAYTQTKSVIVAL
jgi:acyl-CoA reductase-like NAD-dependent aldehyde dehydrogenase